MTDIQQLDLTRPGGAPEAAHRILHEFIERNSIPGLSIAIVDRNGPIFSAGHGYRDLATQAPATPETTYLWFSLTKIVTASATVRLADDGLIDLDAPVADYVPRVGDRNPAATVGQLLDHTAGFVNPMPIRWVRPAHAEPKDATEFLERMLDRHGRPRRDIGGAAHYSNLGYLVLGAVIEAAARQPFTSYVRDTILRPLSLDRTDFVHHDVDMAATGYVKAPRIVTPALTALLPRGIVGPRIGRYQTLQPFYVDGPSYGGLVGNVVDAGRFASAHLNDGSADGARILQRHTARRMRDIDTPGKHIDVGQGWFRRAEHRASTPAHVEHLGAGGGFFNLMRLYPDRGLGFVIMTNTTHPYPHHQLLGELLALPWEPSDATPDPRGHAASPTSSAPHAATDPTRPRP